MCDEKEGRFFKSVCEHAGVALIATDDRLNIRFWNAAAGRMFGGTADVMVGQPLISVVPQERRGLVQRLLDRALGKGEVREFEFRHRDAEDRATYLAATVSPILGGAGRCIGVSACVRDVTRGMDLVRDVAQTQRMSALGSMAGAVAHHFNNLLGGMTTTIDFAQASDDPEVLRRALQATASALVRANGLTQGLLAFAEGDRSDSPVAGVTETVRQFLDANRAAWASRNIAVEADLQELDTPAPVRPLQTVLEILSVNACEAMGDGGTLRFELTRADDDRFLLRLRDTGVGMPLEHLRHVFEPFFTTKRVQNRDLPDHVGLGLAVAHGIVKDLGGTVSVGPGEQGGAVCSLLLPARMAQE